MADLLLNNKKDVKDLVVFDSIPTIVNVASKTTSATKYDINISVSSALLANMDENSYVALNGYRVTGTKVLSQANGRRFFIPSNLNSLAFNIMMALKNIPQLDMMYNFIYYKDNSRFRIISKGYGKEYYVLLTSNINATASYTQSGNIVNELVGTTSSKIYLDLYYKDTNLRKLKATTTTDISNMEYVTTLEKEFYGENVRFDISPVLTTLAKNGSAFEFKADIYASVDGIYKTIGTTNSNYCTRGYLCNQGQKFLDFNDIRTVIPALNIENGSDNTSYNKSTLYVYKPEIEMTLYAINGVTSVPVTIKYLDSDETEIATSTSTITLNNNIMQDIKLTLNEDNLRDAYFVDITFPFGILRYTVINPPFANVDCNRIYWYNSYGGISFFDFTAEKKQDRKTTITTYNKSMLQYYEDGVEEQEIVYSKDVSIETTLTTHLMDENGLYQLYDLQESYTAWIIINNVKYYIIVSEVKADEPSDGIFRGTVKYRYSLIDSFN